MNQWNSGDNDIVIAQPPYGPERTTNQPGLGCVIGIVVTALGLFALLLVGFGLLIFLRQKDIADSNRLPSKFDTTPYAGTVEQRVSEDLSKAKQASFSTEPVRQHPRYDDFEKLIAAAEEAFDDTVNTETDQLIDADRYAEIKLRLLRTKRYRQPMLDGLRKLFSQDIFGPTPFHNAEITKIESVNEGDFQLFITLDIGYGPEPVVWWVTSQDDQLLIYDWCQLDLGLRTTDEDVEVIDAALNFHDDGYEKYSDLCYEYLDTAAESELGYIERRAKVREILRRMEQISVPSKLVPSVKLIIAQRWGIEGEYDESLRMFKRMGDMRQTPGWYKLAGNAYFEQNDFSNAAQQYQKYRGILGDRRHVLQRLATCYQKSGDVEAERDTRLLSVRFLTTYSSTELLRLLSLVNNAKATEILNDVRAQQGDELLISTLSTAKAIPYYWKELRQINDHLKAADPKSRVASISQLYEALTRDDPQIDPQWVVTALNPDDDQDDTFSSYDLWYTVAENNPNDLLQTFQKTGCLKDSLQVIKEIYDNEGAIDDKLMLLVADMATKKHPQWYLPYLIKGNLKWEQNQPEAALESGNKALELFEKFEGASEDEDKHEDHSSYLENSISSLRLWALYELGKQKQAHELAIAKKLVPSLINLKHQAKDFDGLEQLLSELDPDDPLIVLERARTNHRNGKPEQAIEQLANHINKLDSDPANSYGPVAAEYQLAQWCKESDDPLKLYELCPSSVRFREAFRDLLDQKRWQKCEQALERAAKKLSKDERLSSQIRLAWAQKDYQKVCNLAQSRENLADSYAHQDCFQHMVRSAIRTDKRELALAIALEAKEKFSNKTIALTAAIAADKIDIARPLLRSCSKYILTNLIKDKDVGAKLIQAVQNKRLRIDSVSMTYAGSRRRSSAALLTKSPLITKPQQIKTALSKSGIKAIGDVEKLDDQKPGVEAWRSTGGDREFWFIQSRLAPADESSLTDEQKKADIAQAKHVVSVVAFDPEFEDKNQVNNDSDALARTITTQFISDQCLAFQSKHHWISINQLHDESGALKSDVQIVDALDQDNWWYYPPKQYSDLKERDGQRFREALANAARMFEKGQDTFSVSTTIEFEGAQQLVTMQVDSIEVTSFGVSFIGVAETDSPLGSRFGQQVKYSILFNAVVAFSHAKPGPPKNGSKQTFRKTWTKPTN